MRFLFIIFLFFISPLSAAHDKTVLIAILAKDKAHVLPLYLKCLDELEYEKKLITIYINTNNNTDHTQEILEQWSNKHETDYQSILFEAHNVGHLDPTKPHEWTPNRFKILGEIRNKSMRMALENNCDYYFVIDCDNFITPCTLRELVNKDKPIIAPMLCSIPERADPYSNYFCDISNTGYYKDHPDYMKILYHELIGTFNVPVVHCTYLINSNCIEKLSYVDNSDDYEFVIFSRIARQNNIDQFICNEKDFGELLHFYDTNLTLQEEKMLFDNYMMTTTKPVQLR